jgi:hypothetical protein
LRKFSGAVPATVDSAACIYIFAFRLRVDQTLAIRQTPLVFAVISEMENMEKVEGSILTASEIRNLQNDAALDKRVRWRRDLVLVPLLGLMYLVMFLDRTNIANARIEGLEAGLNMPSNGYNVALSIFYIPFVLFEVPSNLVLNLPFIRPRWYLGTMMLVLGPCCRNWLLKTC